MRGGNRASSREQLLSSCSRLLAGALEGHGAPLGDLEQQGATAHDQLQQAAETEHFAFAGREQTGGKPEPHPSVYQQQNAHTELSRANTPLVTPVHAVIRLHHSKASDAVGERREGYHNAGQSSQPGCLRHVLACLLPGRVSSAERRHLEEGFDTIDDLGESLSTSGDERHLRGSDTRLAAGVTFWGGCFMGTPDDPRSATGHRPSTARAGQSAWSVEAVSWEARDLLGCPTHDSYAALLRHLLASDPGLRHAFRAAVRAARAGKLYETTCVMSQLATQHSDLHNSAGRRCLANPWHHMPYIQVQTCLLPAVNASTSAFCDDSGPFRTSSRKSGPHAGAQGAATTAAGIRITHCSVAPEARSVLLDGSACAARARELMMVKSLAADVGQGFITVFEYASGAVLYQNLNSLHYMGQARCGDAGTLAFGDAQAQGLSGPGGGHGVPLLCGDADGEEAAVRVPLVLQELLRHEPGALERLVACLEAGEEFEETVQVPPSLQPVLESLRTAPLAGDRNSAAAAAIAAAPPAATCPLPCAPEAEVHGEARPVRATAPGVLTAEDSTAGGLLSNTSELLLLQLGAQQSVTAATAAQTGEFATASGPLGPAAAAATTATHTAAAAANTTNSEAAPGLFTGHSCQSRISTPGNGSGLSPALMMISRASSASQQGVTSRICSGTSRLGRMTRASTGAGPTSPSGPGLTPVGGSCSDNPVPSQSPLAEWDSSKGVGAAGQPLGGQDTAGAVTTTGAPALPMCIFLPGSSGAAGSAAATPPLTPFAAVPSQQRPGVSGRMSGSGVASRLAQSSSVEPQQLPQATDAVLSCSPGTVASGRSPGNTPSTLSTLTRRLSRFLSRANTYSGGAPAASSTPTGGLLKWNTRSSRHVSPSSMASDPKAAHGGAEPKTGNCGSPPRSSFAAALAALVPSPTAHNSTPVNSCRTTGNGYVARPSGRGRKSCGSPVRTSLQLPAGSSVVLPPSGHTPPFGSGDKLIRKSMSSGGALNGHDRAGYAYGRLQPPGLEARLCDDDHDSHSADQLGDLGFMGRDEHVLSSHGQRRHSNNQRALITGRASTGSCVSPSDERGGHTSPLAALSPRRSVGAYTPYESAPVWSGGSRRIAASPGQQNDTDGGARGHSNSGAACGRAYNSSMARSSTGIQFTGSYGRRFGGTSPRGPNTGIMVTPRRPAVQASPGAVIGSGLMTPTAGGFASGIAPQRSQGAVEAAAASRGEGAGAEGKPAHVGGIVLTGRTDSDLQAIMAIPDRSHIFTPHNRRATVRQALIMDSARTSTSLDMRSYSPAGPRCGSYVARHHAHLPSDHTAGTQSQRTSAGTIHERHSIEMGPGGGTEPTTADGEDTPSGWLGHTGAGVRRGGVTGELSELEASPFALRIDSITALRRLKTTRKPLRRVASHLSYSAVSSPAVTVPDRSSFGKDTAPTSTTEDQARGGAGSSAAHAVRDAEARGSSFGMKRVGSHASRMQYFGEPVAGDSAIEAAVAAAQAAEAEEEQLQLAAEAQKAQETRATSHSGPHVHPACTSLLQPAALSKAARGLGASPLSSSPAPGAGLPPKAPVVAKPSPLQGASAASDMSSAPWSATTMGPSLDKFSCLFASSGGVTKPAVHAHYSCDGRGSMALPIGAAADPDDASDQPRSVSGGEQGPGKRVSEASVNSLLLGFEVLRADIQSLSREGSTAPAGGSGTVRNSVSASSGCSTPIPSTRGGSGGGAGGVSGRQTTSGPLGADSTSGSTVGASTGASRPVSRAAGVLQSLLSRHLRASASVGHGLDGARARAWGSRSPSRASEERREGTLAAHGTAAAAAAIAAASGPTGGVGMFPVVALAPGRHLAGVDGEMESPFHTPRAPGREEALERALALEAGEGPSVRGGAPPPPSAQTSATVLAAGAPREHAGSPSTASSNAPSAQSSCSLPPPPQQQQHLLSPVQRAAPGELFPVDCAVYVMDNCCAMATTTTTTSHAAHEANFTASRTVVPATPTRAANPALDPLIEAAASISSAICAAAGASTRENGGQAVAGDAADGRGSGGSQRTRDSNASAAARPSRRPTSGTGTGTSATLSVADFAATFGFTGVPAAMPGGGNGAGEAGGAHVASNDTLELELVKRKAQRLEQGDGLQQIAAELGMEVELGAVAGLGVGVGAGAKEGAAAGGKDGSDTEAPVHSIMKSGSYTAGAPTPIQRGRSAYGRSRNGRKGYVRQSTHERIEQLLQAARDTSSTVTDDEASGGEGRAARRETGPRVPTGPVWHSVHVCSAAHPVTGCPVLVVTQHDVTSQMDARTQLSQLLEHEHKILESIFPRHVIEYLTLNHTSGDHPGASGRRSARSTRQGSRRQRALAGGAAAGPGAGQQAPQGGLLSLQQHGAQLANVATAHPCVTILFADIVGFTQMSKEVSPLEVMTFLNELYNRFDALLDIYKVYKVETIGDCFMVAGGLVAQDEDGWRTTITHDRLHAVRVMAFAKAMLREARKVTMPTGGPTLMRVGMHSGPVTSGVVGSKMPRFCLFGDTVNTASRMESTSKPGRIHVSSDTHELLPNERWEATGGIMVKGKGMMGTYLWASDVSEEKGERLQRVLGVYL